MLSEEELEEPMRHSQPSSSRGASTSPFAPVRRICLTARSSFEYASLTPSVDFGTLEMLPCDIAVALAASNASMSAPLNTNSHPCF